jgi:hypothetical protein
MESIHAHKLGAFAVALTLVAAAPLAALAQPEPEDEGEVIDAPPPVVMPTLPSPTVQTRRTSALPPPLPPPLPAPSSPPVRFRVGIDAAAGYGGVYLLADDDSYHGPMFDAALTLGWMLNPVRRLQLGLRLHGFYGKTVGEDGCTDGRYFGACPETGHAVGGGSLGFYFETSGFWVSPGIGFMHLSETYGSHTHATTIPEVVIAMGFNIPLGNTLAIHISGEGGTALVTWRAQGTAGLRILF